jgi:hypothetical protein
MVTTENKGKIELQFTRNQTILTPVENQKRNLRSYSNYVTCSNCGKVGYSLVEQKCNIANCIFGVLCYPAWVVYNICKKKDLNCYNAKHDCIHCGVNLAEYNVCEDF